VLFQFAWQSTFQEAWALVYYQRKRREGKSHSTAVRTLANGWARIIYAMWLKHELNTAAMYLHAQAIHTCHEA
jgi:hypothetical protein